jgi:hypothetical protein
MHETVSVVIPLIMKVAIAFVIGWYLLGLGIGIAHRGYNRVAPYRIRRVIEVPQVPKPSTHNWPSRV